MPDQLSPGELVQIVRGVTVWRNEDPSDQRGFVPTSALCFVLAAASVYGRCFVLADNGMGFVHEDLLRRP